ncbi:MAG: PhoH family protein [Clostridia bacterium]|nr:PhoH family protein [Clostridia bacterium]
MEHCIVLFGPHDENVAILQQETGATISMRGDSLVVSGEEEQVDLAVSVAEKLLEMLRRNETIDRSRIRYAVELAREGNVDSIEEVMRDVIAVTYRGKQIKSKTLGQKKYVELMRKNLLTFSVGPAGTGKTYLAMAMAVVALKNKEVERIILTRPAVEAGEKLGFLPGDLAQKVDPYLRPLYDAMYDMMGLEAYQRFVERGAIEVAPLAYMRGRTLSESFVILDEAQNTTSEQMKMFLTRMGEGTRMVVTGDVTQIDLPRDKRSGLVEAVAILEGTPGIGIARLTPRDVVRHELVRLIVSAYEKKERRR